MKEHQTKDNDVLLRSFSIGHLDFHFWSNCISFAEVDISRHSLITYNKLQEFVIYVLSWTRQISCSLQASWVFALLKFGITKRKACSIQLRLGPRLSITNETNCTQIHNSCFVSFHLLIEEKEKLKLAAALKDFTKPTKAGNHPPSNKLSCVAYKHNTYENKTTSI